MGKKMGSDRDRQKERKIMEPWPWRVVGFCVGFPQTTIAVVAAASGTPLLRRPEGSACTSFARLA